MHLIPVISALIHKSTLHFMIAATLSKAMWGTRQNMELFCPPKHGPPHWQLGQLVEFWNNILHDSSRFTFWKDQLAQFLLGVLESRNVNRAKV
jgi:hypothetical protein